VQVNLPTIESYGWQALSDAGRKRRLASPATAVDTIERVIHLRFRSLENWTAGDLVAALRSELVVPAEKYFVSILQSERVPTRYYSGLTSNVDDRIAAHNAGMSPHTASGRPWKFVAAVEFATQERAVEFEQYVKSGSGRAFAKRHLR